MKKYKILDNTIMLMIFNIAKIVFPFITLPYLTRILTTDTYGTVTYVKTIMTYMQIFIDFGFILSATKDIVKCKNNRKELEEVVNNTILARILLGVIGFLIILILCFLIPILRSEILYVILSYIVVFLSIFLLDFLFRGLEKMHVITIRFILMKLISTIFTFVLVKNDSHLLLIPILDIVSTIVAIGLIKREIKREKVKIKIIISNINIAWKLIKESFVYFLSNIAATSFNALSTVIIGLYQSPTNVAYWGISMQIISSIQAFYTPISDGIYPEMIKKKDLNLIKKTIYIVTPFLLFCCILAYLLAPLGMFILGGEKYNDAIPIFRLLIPTAFFGFYSIILGWPTLGAINKIKETTFSTICSIIFNLSLLIFLIIINRFNLITVAVARVVTEVILCVIRLYICLKNKLLFSNENIREE